MSDLGKKLAEQIAGFTVEDIKSLTDQKLAEDYVNRPKQRCRDCADENGVCPHSGRACDTKLANKAATEDFLAGRASMREEVKELEVILTQIKNSIAVASWNVKPEFREWAKEMDRIISEAVSGSDLHDLLRISSVAAGRLKELGSEYVSEELLKAIKPFAESGK